VVYCKVLSQNPYGQTEENNENSQNNGNFVPDLNTGPSKCEAGMPTTRHRRSINTAYTKAILSSTLRSKKFPHRHFACVYCLPNPN